MVLPITPEVTLEVDWDGLGTFDGDNDDVTNDVDMTDGASLTFNEGRNGYQSLNPPRIRDGAFSLLNEDGTYSQEKAGSPVYQRVIPGKPVRYTVRHGERRLYRSHTLYRAHVPYRGMAVYSLGQHLIDDIAQDTEIGNRRVNIATIGIETVLARATVTIPLMVAPRVDQVVTAYLDAVDWPADQRRIATSDTTLTYYYADARVPWEALTELLGAEGPGTFYVRGGTFHFENRNYRTTATRSTTSQATLFDRVDGIRVRYRDHLLYREHRLYRGRTSGLFFTKLDYLPSFKSIINRATYRTTQRAAGSAGTVIWTYGADVVLAASQVRTLIARPSDPFTAAITPTSPTDFTVSGGTVSVSLNATSGLVAFITIAATSGTPTVTGLQLRATPLTVVGATDAENTVDASASIARFSPIPGADIPLPYSVPGWSEIDIPNAEAVCDAWVNRYMVQRPQVPIVVRNADAAHLRLILESRISDRWTLIEASTGLASDVWVNSKELTFAGQGGRIVSAVFGCEKVEEVSGSVWDGPGSLWNSAVWGI